MKKFWLPLLLLLPLSSSAPAGVPCTLPFNLQNGTPADATQVMANYQALVTCLGLAAVAGANNDITSLTALTTPISPAQGGTPVYTGGVAGGSANALTVNPVTPGGFTLQAGRAVSFVIGANNTGSTTLAVGGSPAVAFQRRTHVGLAPMVGGELVTGEAVTAYYDGTNFQLMSTSIIMVGEIRDYAGVAIPAGWTLMDGSCQSRTGPMATLFVLVGTTYDPTGSTCDSANFALPDGRGRVMAAVDPTGTRLTTTGCAAIGGAGCGVQNFKLVAAQIPTMSTVGVAVSFSSLNITVSQDTAGDHTHTFNSGLTNALQTAGGQNPLTGGAVQFGSAAMDSAGGHTHPNNLFNQNLLSPTVTQGSVGTALVSQTVTSVVQPTLVVNKIIKF